MLSQQPSAELWQQHAGQLSECMGSVIRLNSALGEVPPGALKDLTNNAIAELALIASWLQRQPQLLDRHIALTRQPGIEVLQHSHAASSSACGASAAARVEGADAEVMSTCCTMVWFVCIKILTWLLADGAPETDATAAAAADSGMAAAAAADASKRAAEALASELFGLYHAGLQCMRRPHMQ
jgi:hypothetical protein